MSLPPPEVDVAIVGCGPVGAAAANFLGMYGVRCAVLERDTAAHGQPRAFSCDDEALRIYQQIGLVDRLREDMITPQRVDYVGVGHRTFAEIEFTGVDFGSGYAPLHFFHQPTLEGVLRDGIRRFPNVSVHLGCELRALTRADDHATLEVAAGDARASVRARFVLGCDGAHSLVRRLVGVEMHGARYEEPWLAVAGFAPEAALRLPNTRFVCDPDRPAFVGLGPHGEVRIELMVMPGEDPAALEAPARLRELVAPFVDPDRYQVTRAAVYRFGKHVAERWQVGPVLLLGDAAHQMPPFMGQGLVSGLRDVANVAWKLALVARGAAGPEILASYELERRQHTQAMIDVSVRMGYVFLSRSRWSASMRDAVLRALQRVPRVRRFVREFEFKPPPRHTGGLYAHSARAWGTYFPQAAEPRLGRSDEALGPDFAVLTRGADPRAALDPALLGRLGARVVRVAREASPEVDLVDASGAFHRWLDRHDADVAVVRPDRFVFGAGRAAELPALARALAHAFA